MDVLYQDFRKLHPNMKMSFSTFKRRRPQNIVLSSSRKFLQCLCEKCTNMMLLMDVVNPFLPKKTEETSYCNPLIFKVKSAEELVERTLCKEALRCCWERNCSNCGVDSFISAIRQEVKENLNSMKKWSKWEKTEKSSKELVHRENSLEEIIGFLNDRLISLAKHVKTAEWQRAKYQELKENLPRQHAMCTLDFAENYLCKYQNEVQSALWSYRQVSVHPCVFFFRCSESDCFKTITDYVVFLSDDLKHDHYFTNYITEWCINYVKSKGIACLHVFSDGCSSQYKSRHAFKDLTRLQGKHNDVKITRHFFGANHGKSLCDSCGGTVKNTASWAVASGSHIIQSAAEMFEFCQEKLSTPPDDCSQSHANFVRSFVLIDKKDILRQKESSSNVMAVKGTRELHFLKPIESDVLKWKSLSCNCSACLLGEEGVCCQNESFTHKFKTVRLSCSVSNKKCNVNAVSDNSSNSQSKADNNVEHVKKNVLVPNSLGLPLLRAQFFVSVLQDFGACNDYNELCQVVKNVSSQLPLYPLPEIIPRTVLEVGIADSVALRLVPDGLKYLYPVLTIGDGNCVPRALSLLGFGDQEHHVEMRCRIVIESVCNQLDYLCLDTNDLNLLCRLSDFPSPNIQETFQQEILHICHNATYMGMWQLMAAANVLNANILSAYPTLGPKCVRDLFNRTLRPRQCLYSNTVCLLWSATEAHNEEMPEDHWTANHVVPLLPLSQPMEIVTSENEG